MGKKTRFLQLSDVIMMEYDFQMEGQEQHGHLDTGLIYTKLKDGHYAVFSPGLEECSSLDYKKYYNDEMISSNTINHLAVPTDKKLSSWFTFLDPDYEYVTADNIGLSLNINDTKVSELKEYCINPTDESAENPFVAESFGELTMKCDSFKLYFVNGYDFSNIYGILARISVTRTDDALLDLSNYFVNRSMLYKLVRFLESPIIFGNNIYDRYLEIKLPSLYALNSTEDFEELNEILKVAPSSSVTLNFSYIDNDSYELVNITRDVSELAGHDDNGDEYAADNRGCKFVRSSSIRGSIPTETITSDNLGIYLAETPTQPYIEFYGTWSGSPLSFDIVQNFNRGNIKLYDTRFIKKKILSYEVESDYSAEVNLKKWVVMHELVLHFIGDDNIQLKEETYNMSQIFANRTDEIVKFYYRPIIFDEPLATSVRSIHVSYTMKLINIEDGVQFIKTGSIGITDNLSKFYGKGTSIPDKAFSKYDVFNKIIENKHAYSGAVNMTTKTKYVKVFYNSTDIALKDSDGVLKASSDFDLVLSSVPKNYKFIFKKAGSDGNFEYMDLTDGSYKLYAKDSAGTEIIIDPTYSENMNMMLGELEYNITSNVLSSLSAVEEGSRKMSIVSISDNNYVSSMFDFTYSF